MYLGRIIATRLKMLDVKFPCKHRIYRFFKRYIDVVNDVNIGEIKDGSEINTFDLAL